MPSIKELAEQRMNDRATGGRTSDPDAILVELHWPDLVLQLDPSQLSENAQGLRDRVERTVAKNAPVFYQGDPSFYARQDTFGGYRKNEGLSAWQNAIAAGAGLEIGAAVVVFEHDTKAAWLEGFELMDVTEAEAPKLEKLSASAQAVHEKMQADIDAASIVE
jgi:hypothetical protein